MRRWASAALLVLSGLFLFVGLLSSWANTTVYDSATFSERPHLACPSAQSRSPAQRLTAGVTLYGPGGSVFVGGRVMPSTLRSLTATERIDDSQEAQADTPW